MNSKQRPHVVQFVLKFKDKLKPMLTKQNTMRALGKDKNVR